MNSLSGRKVYIFTAYGKWQGGADRPKNGPCGLPKELYPHTHVAPELPAYSLIAKCTGDDGDEYQEISYDPFIDMGKYKECRFLMNDAPGKYLDNSGFIEVLYTRRN